MKTTLIILSILALSFSGTVLFAQSNGQPIEGNWYAEDLSKSTILIYRDQSGAYFGRIIKSADDKLVNKVPLVAFTFHSDKNLFIGTIKPATRNFELDGELSMIDENTIRLVGRMLFISKTFLLKKEK
nr:hypothetical protein [Cytophagales bacterium]